MRRTLTLCRSGLAAAAAVVLLTACGGSKDDTASSETTESTTSSSSESESSAPGADSEFCTEAAAIQERVIESFSGTDEQSDLGAIFQQAAEEVQAIDPPAELADDWTAFAEGLQEFADISQIDFNDPQAATEWQAKAAEVQTRYAAAFTRVETYLATECGITDEPTESASPTS